MQLACLDGIWYKYDDIFTGDPDVLVVSDTMAFYKPHKQGGWQRIPDEKVKSVLESVESEQVHVMVVEKLTLKELYTKIYEEAALYTGAWSAATDINTWLADSQQFAVGKALIAKRNTEIVLDVPEALFDRVLLTYLRERIEIFAYFLKLVREGTYA